MILVVITGAEPPVEALRLAVGLVAGGHTVRLLEAGSGRGVLSASDDLPEEAEGYLRGLAEFDVTPEPADAATVRTALLASHSVMRIGDPARSGEPTVLELTDDAIRSSSDDELIALLAAAGQVIRS